MGFIIIGLIGTGIYLLYLERTLIRKGFLSYKWPRVKAVIQDQRDASFSITGYNYQGLGSGTVRFYEMAYTYEYKVGNHIFHSSNYCFGGHGDRAPATFLIGQHISVYYNPDNPRESVIKRGVTVGGFIGLLPIILAIAGLVMMALMKP